MALRRIALALALFLGCGDDDAASRDAAVDAGVDGGDGIEDPVAPMPAALPDLGACADGWRPLDESGVTLCEPWPESGRATCTGAEAHFPGEPGCAPVGTTCPSGEHADDLPADAIVVFVSAGAPAGGDGTRATPLSTISAGVSAATTGMTVAIGKGTWDEALSVRREITLHGACPVETIVASSTATASDGTIRTGRSGATIRNLQVGGNGPGLRISDGVSTTVEGVLVLDAEFAGIRLDAGAELVARDLIVRSTRPWSMGMEFGIGIDARENTSVELARTAIEDNRQTGVRVFMMSTLRTDGSVIHGTRSRATDGWFGRGIDLHQTTADLHHTVIEDSREYGAFSETMSDLTLADSVVRGTRRSIMGFGHGVGAQLAGSFTLQRTLVQDNEELNVGAAFAGSSLALADVVVRDTLPRFDGRFGRGVNLETEASGVLSRVASIRSTEAGVLVGASTATISDLTVLDTAAEPATGDFGRGAVVQIASTVELTRAHLERNQQVGLDVADSGSSVTGSDLLVADTRASEAPGINGAFGQAVHAQFSAVVELERVELRGNHEVALISLEESSVRLTEVTVRDTLPRPCVTSTCAGEGAGFGATIARDGMLHLERFLIADNALVGVQIVTPGVRLVDGEIRGHTVGVNVQLDGFDITSVTDDVRYRDNDVNLDSMDLPVPDPLTGL